MSPSDRPSHRWVVVVPVKTLSRAKSRLHTLPDGVRRELAAAFALDAVTAALATDEVAEVRVVTDETDLGAATARLGALRVPDLGGGDLNAALRSAVFDVPGGRVAALLGDLPCLEPAELGAALRAAADAGGGFVADHAGTGTTLLAVAGPEDFRPRFGPGSREAHRDGGVHELDVAAPTLRLDVDTVADLEAAVALGVGPHTLRALETVEHRSA